MTFTLPDLYIGIAEYVDDDKDTYTLPPRLSFREVLHEFIINLDATSDLFEGTSEWFSGQGTYNDKGNIFYSIRKYVWINGEYTE